MDKSERCFVKGFNWKRGSLEIDRAKAGLVGTVLTGVDVGGLYWFGLKVHGVAMLAPALPEDFRVARSYFQERPESVSDEDGDDDGMEPAYAAGNSRMAWWGGSCALFNMVPGDGVVMLNTFNATTMNGFGVVRSVSGGLCVVDVVDRQAAAAAALRRLESLETLRTLVGEERGTSAAFDAYEGRIESALRRTEA